MTSKEIRAKFLEFFKKRGHTILPSASLVPENDPSVLFNTAGMQPLVPYLLGAPHPAGKRLADSQKCVRTQDIDEVGDNTHDTFFEMLGNWSLGDYFKKDAITWSWEFITSQEEGLGLDPNRLYITVFGGNEDAPKDEETYNTWLSLGVPETHIYWMDGKLAEKNWWSPGDNGPCGPDTEMFYDVRGGLNLKNRDEFLAADDRQDIVEFWNDVFMEYEKKDGKVIGKLNNKNVDTGAGLERVVMLLQGKSNIFETDLFKPLMDKIDELSSIENIKARRVVADHIRTAVFMIGDGVIPSNTDRGYILRRLLRRAVRYADVLGMKHGSLFWLAGTVPSIYGDAYPNIVNEIENIKKVIDGEEHKFRETLEKGIREFEKIAASGQNISASDAFSLFSTYGLPIDIIVELASDKKLTVDVNGFNEQFKKHQELSRAGSEQKFRGGLADHKPETVRLHTAHHLLLAALQNILGDKVHQRGSNITSERLRIDFSFDRKMTDEEKKKVEDLVNSWIREKIPVIRRDMPKAEAEALGAEHEFGATYGDIVSVYFVERGDGSRVSKEFCGGPHVQNTGELSHFKILKEEAVASGVRRIKAILE